MYPPNHTPTSQETAIYTALTVGDHQAIDQLHQTAAVPPYTPPQPTPPDWNPGPEQWATDYQNASAHYQDDHETPELDRVENTADTVAHENANALETP